MFWVNENTYVPPHSFCPVCGPFATFSYSVYIHTSGHSKVLLTSVCSSHSSSAGQSCFHLVDISLTLEAVTLMLLCHSNVPQNIGMTCSSIVYCHLLWGGRAGDRFFLLQTRVTPNRWFSCPRVLDARIRAMP